MTMVAASWWWIGPGTLAGKRASNEQPSAMEGSGASTPTAIATTQQVAVPSEVQATATTVIVPVQQVVPTAVLLPTATPTPVIAGNLVLVTSETPTLVDANPSHVVLVEATIFDIRQYLREQGFAALAELAIDARLQGQTLLLQGFVHLDSERRELIEIAGLIPSVAEVNSVNLLLRPLPTYTVLDGDTLWSIVFTIYGNVDRLDEFAAYNRDVLPSPDAIAPGMELKVLPIQ